MAFGPLAPTRDYTLLPVTFLSTEIPEVGPKNYLRGCAGSANSVKLRGTQRHSAIIDQMNTDD
jgi:hypothetical protein